MASWLSWFSGRKDRVDQRESSTPPASITVGPDDIDPLTGALRWERFLVMLDAERAKAPGVLLLVDLSARSESVAAIVPQKEGDILPWLAQAIRQAMRADDLLAHVDKYRFAALLRGAPQHVADNVSARILESVDNTIFMTSDGIARLGVTVGGAVYGRATPGDIVASAMASLGEARSSGTPAIIQ